MEIHKLLSAGWDQERIGERFGVDQSAVSHRLGRMGIRLKGPQSKTTAALPWNLADHPDKRRLVNQAPFRGLRYFLRKRDGQELTERAEKDLKAFLNRIQEGQVLALLDGAGFAYVPREDGDGDLVVRWPEGAPRDPQRLSPFVHKRSPVKQVEANPPAHEAR